MIEIKTGNDLKIWRTANHLTQKELSKQIDYSISSISKYEYLNNTVPKKLIDKIKNLDKYLNPKYPIAETWAVLSENVSGYCKKELSEIEANFIELITIDDQMGLDDTKMYLGYLDNSLKKLVEIKRLSDAKQEVYGEDTTSVLNGLLKETNRYFKAMELWLGKKELT